MQDDSEGIAIDIAFIFLRRSERNETGWSERLLGLHFKKNVVIVMIENRASHELVEIYPWNIGLMVGILNNHFRLDLPEV